MKKTIKINKGTSIEEKEINYIPIRYILAIIITIIEVLLIIGIVIVLGYFFWWFRIPIIITEIAVILIIIASDDNPEYKIPWLLFVIILPIVGFMLYFLFYSRKLKKGFVKKLKKINSDTKYNYNDSLIFEELKNDNQAIYSQAKMITNIASTHLFKNTNQKYLSIGEEYFTSLINDLKNAQKFIFMEYFIISLGKFWNTILDILKEKAKNGVIVKLIYDDIGCMSTLSGSYNKELKKFGIDTVIFSKLRGEADNKFNNRSHRKITVIDGIIGYTGGINIADEYINNIKRFGHWKDIGIRIEGEGVYELTKLFLIDFKMNLKKDMNLPIDLFPKSNITNNGFIIPFGDGPKPLYERRVSECTIKNMINMATKSIYITTPYLICSDDLFLSLENAALRGVEVSIITPHIPDKKLVYQMTKANYLRLINAGVNIHEYEPGFIHAKSYLIDDIVSIIGTINLDYRSLAHHFENGIWLYKCEAIKDLKNDLILTINKSIKINKQDLKTSIFMRFIRSIIKIFSPLL